MALADPDLRHGAPAAALLHHLGAARRLEIDAHLVDLQTLLDQQPLGGVAERAGRGAVHEHFHGQHLLFHRQSRLLPRADATRKIRHARVALLFQRRHRFRRALAAVAVDDDRPVLALGELPGGRGEARAGGRQIKAAGLDFDLAFTSVLKRAIRTLWLTLDELDRLWLPEEKSWRLNERHYGALQGLNKAETAAKFGEQQVLVWRRSYDVPPPALAADDPRYEAKDPRYAGVEVPRTECLKDTVARVIPYWNSTIAPAVRAGRRVLVAAHGNSLRALVKHLDGIGDAEIVRLNNPTRIPLVYELDEALRPSKHYYLGDAAEVARRVAAVSAQGKAKV